MNMFKKISKKNCIKLSEMNILVKSFIALNKTFPKLNACPRDQKDSIKCSNLKLNACPWDQN